MSEEPIRGEQDHNHCGREVTSLKKDDTSDPRDEEHDLPEQGEPEISFAGWDAIAHTDHLCILAIGGAPQVDPSGLRRAHGKDYVAHRNAELPLRVKVRRTQVEQIRPALM
ncbi:hypothetical protein IVB14_08150 [Bradyrhizobium sp. 180]|uniref:hypothetical protein n=1 Tax=unclassified Bradyrhizobium TaxID=2631580 RepID=UPI001FF83431|nr:MULTISPECIES: hypothetical protein [unclassified Bradyrhizobium]MCK1425172.1 hypothetical protein [Bradyrhizobium sp. CW12]MCK1490388.1 hypothetical protein [Bradyrhizobium sp. 180]MCK1532537.1 hypothetical protein [Bradyrhizobium sp. 182]MCK1616819.1 hypothetical protein [Bradyrhizobium sp. 159]MCK1645446.1 hypothetical protein [Bradyrhizobium sp. 154]